MTAKKSILVIEDEEGVRERLIRMLVFEGYAAEGAANGREGIERAWSVQPDLVICDLMMPGINGFGVCRVLRDDPLTAATPVLVLTALTAACAPPVLWAGRPAAAQGVFLHDET